MMGVGKSTVGKNLANKLNYNFVDIDKLIEEKEGSSINLIFLNKGENYFCKIEIDITLNELKKKKFGYIFRWGFFLSNTIRKSAKKIISEFLVRCCSRRTDKKIKKNNHRPLLFKKNVSDAVKKIYFERKKIYNEADSGLNVTLSNQKK